MLKNDWSLALLQLYVVNIHRGPCLVCSQILLNDAMNPSTFARYFHLKQGRAEGWVNGVTAPAIQRGK